MIVCDAIAKDVLNIVWMMFHLIGLAANLYVGWALKKKWTSIGNFKLLLGTNVFSNVFALAVHLYLPINFIIRGVIGRHWRFGSLPCIVLPPVANFALAASVLALLAVVTEHYYRNIYKGEVSIRDAENTTVLVWSIACLITAPQFCQCGTGQDTHLDAENCIQGWQFTDSGRFYEANRLILQYIIPFLIITNLYIKVQIFAFGFKKYSKFRRSSRIIADVLTGVLIGASAFFFPVRTLLSAQKYSFGLSSPDVASANQVMEFLTVFCCIATPFKLLEILNDEKLKAAFRKNKEMRKHKTTKAKITGKLSEKKLSELLRNLVNEEPFRLKNEIIV